jgi:citrate synthase
MIYALTKNHPEEEQLDLLNICLNHLTKSDDFLRTAVLHAKENNANPNQTLMSFFTLAGDNKEFKISRKYISNLLNIFSEIGLRDINSEIDFKKDLAITEKYFDVGENQTTSFSRFLIKKIKSSSERPSILDFALELISKYQVESLEVYLISAVFLNLAYTSLVLKKVTRSTVENIFTYLSLESKAVLLVSKKPKHNEYLSEIQSGKNFEVLSTSFTETAYQAVFNKAPNKQNIREFSALLALTLTNGPGTISAKGAKESVSARNNIATSYTGFLANTGLAHGGNGYEAIEFLLKSFKDIKIETPGTLTDEIDVENIAQKVAEEFLEYKNEMKFKGIQNYKRIPCINHPVFKGKKKNIDPREDFLYKQFKSENINNLFWEFYHHLVENLYSVGATNNIYCVNIDAVIAVISLKLMWKKLKTNLWKKKDVQDIGFIIFLLGRMVGVSAEISDHMDRGTDMDCRTPQSETRFVV